jgi:hypothetical protein
MGGIKMVQKFWSARFWAFLMVIATLCYIAMVAANAALGVIKLEPAIKDVVEKTATFILGSFVTIVTGMYKEYFDRNDRSEKSHGGTETFVSGQPFVK